MVRGDPAINSLFLHVTMLICADWPIAFCRPDVNGPHIVLALVETVKECEAVFTR